jgi:ferric-dicitrate binding protein FerR (iron transport regulator)
MPEIYNILSKHFLKEASETEEQQIEEFKKTNSTEYKILKQLWIRGDIKVIDFDSVKAWNTVQDKITEKNQRQTKVIPLYKNLRRIAAVAAIFIFGAIPVYYFVQTYQTPEIIIAQASLNEKAKVILLSDGSKVWLNRNATLTYPEKFGKSNRNVELKGEAFFEVIKNPDKPFIVRTSNSIIEVLGTSFNINSEFNKTKITVSTGKVKATNTDESNNVIIIKGYSAIVSENQIETYQTANPNYLSWKTGEFVFRDVEIRKVVEDLNTYYKKQIIIKDSSEIGCLLTANFKQTKLQEVIEIIELTCDVNISVTDK